ncbi:hypothetical protein DL96DRAFT_1610305 [Flagelloscypha sp. PMI_526]|nr:hypothetical protein DL96DRAFT_1610305 [Flagelloscypha sp. PMI_526]
MEISVLEDGAPQGKLLSLVSQHVQAWVDPLLFKKVKDIAKLSIITSSPRLTRAARRASCLYGASFASSKSLNSLAHHFPALHTLILESEVNWRIWDDEVTFIRRLECYPGQATVAFSRAIFPNITHLSLVYPAIDKIYWPWLSQIPALHFLALMTSQRWWQDDEHRQIFKLTEVVRNMSRVTKRHIESDSLKVILWHQSNFHSISLDEFEKGAQEIVDDRLIVGIPTRTRSGPVTWYDRRTHIWPFLQVPLDRWGHTRCLLDLAPEAGELLRSREVFGLFQHA